jgi:hypothetical protein
MTITAEEEQSAQQVQKYFWEPKMFGMEKRLIGCL